MLLRAFLGLSVFSSFTAFAGGGGSSSNVDFPKALTSYGDEQMTSIIEILIHRAQENPFNLFAFGIFVAAIVHTFMTGKFLHMAHEWEKEHQKKIAADPSLKGTTHYGAGFFHFLGEVEVVFGLWAVALLGVITWFFGWHTAVDYISHKVNFTEALFVIVIMTLSATRPILKLSELLMWKIANIFGGKLGAWWLTILTVGPLLGSFITEPAAMTISALLLSKKFYRLEPKIDFKYATIGLLFVNISVGGTLTHFAAPPVLMVAGPWDWGMGFMLMNFGWKAVIGIAIANALYYFKYKDALQQLQTKYNVICLEYELQNEYLKSRDIEEAFITVEHVITEELGFNEAFESKSEEIKNKTRDLVFAKIVDPKEYSSDEEFEEKFEQVFTQKFDDIKYDKLEGMSYLDLFEWAFEKKFDEIKVRAMRETVPGLLPKGLRVPFRDPDWDNREDKVPWWLMGVHLSFMVWTVVNAHHPALFIGGLLFFLGFAEVTWPFQNRVDLKPALLVGFFLSGLVIHGGVQGWWIAPVLGSLSEVPLMISATVLTAFNDNAAITYLSTLVPNFGDSLKYAVVAGAVTGGGLTVIANAPNPAGLSILKGYFKDGFSPILLVKAALLPTVILGAIFMIFR